MSFRVWLPKNFAKSKRPRLRPPRRNFNGSAVLSCILRPLVTTGGRFCLHEFPAFECHNVRRTEFKPFPIFALCCKAVVPVSLDAGRVVSPDDVNLCRLFGKLDSKLV